MARAMKLFALVGRFLLVLLLYAASGQLGYLALGAAISPQMEPAAQEAMSSAFGRLFFSAVAVSWLAGLLWIGRAVDAIMKRKAPALVFFALALACAAPQVAEETRLSILTLVTWTLTPPALMIAIYRLIR